MSSGGTWMTEQELVIDLPAESPAAGAPEVSQVVSTGRIGCRIGS